MKRTAALFTLLFFIFLNCRAIEHDTVIIVTFSYAKQNITTTVHKGDILLVKLPMASGTGFVWEISRKPDLCMQGDTKYENINSRLPGASMMEVLNFSITATGKGDINFIYHRPFEKNKAPAKTKTLHLIVK